MFKIIIIKSRITTDSCKNIFQTALRNTPICYIQTVFTFFHLDKESLSIKSVSSWNLIHKVSIKIS